MMFFDLRVGTRVGDKVVTRVSTIGGTRLVTVEYPTWNGKTGSMIYQRSRNCNVKSVF